jgi:hypothetical protein
VGLEFKSQSVKANKQKDLRCETGLSVCVAVLKSTAKCADTQTGSSGGVHHRVRKEKLAHRRRQHEVARDKST